MRFYTYLHCKPDGTPFYVGKGVDKYYPGHGIDRRSHSKKNRNKHHKNITAKYGWENIIIHIFPCESESQALADEIKQIAQLRREGYKLANLTDGGEGYTGRKHSAETKAKLSAASTGNRNAAVPCSSEKAARISRALTGKHLSMETRAKLSKIRLGNTYRVGTAHSLDTRAKMSASHLGKSMSHKGKPWSEARRAAQDKRNLEKVNKS